MKINEIYQEKDSFIMEEDFEYYKLMGSINLDKKLFDKFL